MRTTIGKPRGKFAEYKNKINIDSTRAPISDIKLKMELVNDRERVRGNILPEKNRSVSEKISEGFQISRTRRRTLHLILESVSITRKSGRLGVRTKPIGKESW